MNEPKLNLSKQRRLPVIQQKEALASLGMLWADAYIEPFLTAEEKHVHTSNVLEYLELEGAMTRELKEKLIPF